jgi:16S rRNA (uracil1498-N3)-methyltransferase
MLDYWKILEKEYRRPVGIMFHQEPLATEPLEKGSLHGYLGNYPDFAAMAVGPEGGFSPREVSLMLAAGWKPVVMGNTILRTETAALYGAAAIRVLLLESETWTPRQTESCSSKSLSI